MCTKAKVTDRAADGLKAAASPHVDNSGMLSRDSTIVKCMLGIVARARRAHLTANVHHKIGHVVDIQNLIEDIISPALQYRAK